MAENDNATIKEMRDQITALEKDLNTTKQTVVATTAEKETLATTLAANQQALTEAQTALASAADVTPFQEALNSVYEDIIMACPENVRESLRKVSANGTMPERLNVLKAAVELANANIPVANPTVGAINPAGVIGAPAPVTTPTTPIAPEVIPPRLAPNNGEGFNVPGWADVLVKPRV